MMELPVPVVLNCLSFLIPFRVHCWRDLEQLSSKLPILHVVEFYTESQTSTDLDRAYSRRGKPAAMCIGELHVKAGGIPRLFLRDIFAQGLSIVDLELNCQPQMFKVVQENHHLEEAKEVFRELARFISESNCRFRNLSVFFGVCDNASAQLFGDLSSKDTRLQKTGTLSLAP